MSRGQPKEEVKLSALASDASTEHDIRLTNTAVDRVTAAAKGGLGAIPVVGGLASEIISAVIPNQRIDRIVRFVALLSAKVKDLERERLIDKMKQEELVDLFEDSLIQASRALTDERRERLASFMKNALAKDDLEHQYRKRLLQLLGEINDVELLVLASYDMTFNQAREFHELHKGALRGPRVTMASSREEVDKGAVHDSYVTHLVQLGLLVPCFERPPRDNLGVPEFDQRTGMMKASGHNITTLGRLLLTSVDLSTFNTRGAAT